MQKDDAVCLTKNLPQHCNKFLLSSDIKVSDVPCNISSRTQLLGANKQRHHKKSKLQLTEKIYNRCDSSCKKMFENMSTKTFRFFNRNSYSRCNCFYNYRPKILRQEKNSQNMICQINEPTKNLQDYVDLVNNNQYDPTLANPFDNLINVPSLCQEDLRKGITRDRNLLDMCEERRRKLVNTETANKTVKQQADKSTCKTIINYDDVICNIKSVNDSDGRLHNYDNQTNIYSNHDNQTEINSNKKTIQGRVKRVTRLEQMHEDNHTRHLAKVISKELTMNLSDSFSLAFDLIKLTNCCTASYDHERSL